MQLAVISHKLCWKVRDSPIGFVTDGGFPLQMEALSDLFSATRVVVPCEIVKDVSGVTPMSARNLTVVPLGVLRGTGFLRKLRMITWLLSKGPVIWQEVRKADAVHTPIPGDIGTVGMVFALVQRKPLFVRHCGNWFEQRTLAEHFWKWAMERFAGRRNVMFATGGAAAPPSAKNRYIKWIFSTSLSEMDLRDSKPKTLTRGENVKLVTVGRQELGKGTDIVIESLPLILERFPGASLDVVGDGSQIPYLRRRVAQLTLQSRVKFHGKVSQNQVSRILKGSDIFCFPTASEGFPKSVLEAMACGLPVITTPVSVLPQLIQNDSGILLDHRTPEAVAEAVIRLGTNRVRYGAMSLSAIMTAQRYTLENWRDHIGEALRSAWNVESLRS